MNTPITYPSDGQKAFTVHTYGIVNAWHRGPDRNLVDVMFSGHDGLWPFNNWEPGEMIASSEYADIIFPDPSHMRDRQPSRVDYSFGGTGNEWDLVDCRLGQEPDTDTGTPDSHETAD